MSRTKKDRPYWVKCNDDSLRPEVTHRHNLFGRKLFRYVTVRDENGDPVMRTVSYTTSVFRWGAAENENVTYQQAVADEIKYAHLWRDEVRTHETSLMRVSAGTYAEECTGNVKTQHESAAAARSEPCFRSVRVPYEPITKMERKWFAGEKRRDARRVLNRYVKEVNGGEDLYDAEDEEPSVPYRSFKY